MGDILGCGEKYEKLDCYTIILSTQYPTVLITDIAHKKTHSWMRGINISNVHWAFRKKKHYLNRDVSTKILHVFVSMS